MGDHDWGDQLLVALGDLAQYLLINEVFLIIPQLEIDIRLSKIFLMALSSLFSSKPSSPTIHIALTFKLGFPLSCGMSCLITSDVDPTLMQSPLPSFSSPSFRSQTVSAKNLFLWGPDLQNPVT